MMKMIIFNTATRTIILDWCLDALFDRIIQSFSPVKNKTFSIGDYFPWISFEENDIMVYLRNCRIVKLYDSYPGIYIEVDRELKIDKNKVVVSNIIYETPTKYFIGLDLHNLRFYP